MSRSLGELTVSADKIISSSEKGQSWRIETSNYAPICEALKNIVILSHIDENVFLFYT